MSYIISKALKSRIKIITLVIIFVVIPVILFAQPAPISQDDLSLGGIYIGDSVDKVVKIYGKPLNTRRLDQNNLVYSYENITIHFNRHNGVDHIESSPSNAANSVTTPRGIAVGNSYEDLLNAYGKSDRRDSFANNIIGYTYGLKIKSSFLLLFKCDSRTNKIVEISLYDAV